MPSGQYKSLRGDNAPPEEHGNEVRQTETKDNYIREYALDKMHRYKTSKQAKWRLQADFKFIIFTFP